MAQNKLPTWASVLIAAVIIIGLLAVSVAGGAAFFIYRHVNTTVTAQENAETEFTAARARFGDATPLIEIRRDEEPIVHRELLPASTTDRNRKVESLCVLAYDMRAGKLVRISIPFWLLRLTPNHFSVLEDRGIDLDSDHVRLTLDDIERRGPGLILEQTSRRGSKVLVWTE